MTPARLIFHDPRLAALAGGGESLTLRTVAALDRRAFRATVLTRRPVTSLLLLGFRAEHPHVEIVEFDAPADGCDSGVGRFLRDRGGEGLWGHDPLVDDGVRFNSAAAAFYRSAAFDLVSVSFLSDLFGLGVGRRAAFHVYGVPPAEMAEAEGPLLAEAAAVAAVSGYARDRFCDVMAGWAEPGGIEVLPPAVPEAFFAPLAAASRNVDFLYAGRLVPRKGVDLILEAVARLGRDGVRPRVVVAGDGASRGELVELRDRLGLAGQVEFAGPLAQGGLIALLDRARWFLYPTRRPEAFGLAPLEAMARGVPAVVGTPGGMAEYVEPGRNGHVMVNPDAPRLADLMLALHRDPKSQSRLAADCVDTARRFSWEAFAGRVNAFYARACRSVG